MTKLKIRRKILFILLLTSIIPFGICILFMSNRIFNQLNKDSYINYSTILKNLSWNIDLMYSQYEKTLTNMMKLGDVKKGLYSGDFKDAQDELDVTNRVVGYEGVKSGDQETMETGMRQTIEERIDGYCVIYQLNRKSIIDKTDYKAFKSSRYVQFPNYEELIKEPMFKELTNNKTTEMSLVKLSPNVYPKGSPKEVSDIPVLLYPYYSNPKDDKFDIFLFVGLSYGFIEKFYNEIFNLQYGTFYILDKFDNIVSFNHPNEDDYYQFDEKNGKYIIAKDDKQFDDITGMTFKEYNLLNTDINILKTNQIKELINKYKINYGKINKNWQIITYKKIDYLTIIEYSPKTHLKFVYFQPIDLIRKPIYILLNYILIIASIIIVCIILLSLILSKSFTKSIKVLRDATYKISCGNYNEFVSVQSRDEIFELSENFNKMIKSIKLYQDRLLSAEREKKEMEVASRIQTSLLPSEVKSKYYNISAIMIPAEKVGGDYYDIIVGETEDKLWFGIGDVSGHGLVSGLIMMMAQTAFNTVLLNDPKISTSDLIKRVNKVLYQNIRRRLAESHFMTISFMVIDNFGDIKYAGAHLDILIYRNKTKEIERVQTTGIWLGLVEDLDNKILENSLKMEKDDTMLLYTDGLIEARNKNNELYDMNRFINKFREIGQKSVLEIREEIIADVKSFISKQDDDISLVVIKKI
ncbi:MAG: hypothetical protein A2Y34_15110 [Spirochaetes bacterium GWC1_27_15]|nr:MAG: hypothetical protein A2Z98_11175 [Spirochaetes bacterium GWB1_27_13]OHD21629.1 MAG: hypothetical protein A2Y34_15110 [Spirochaetes bacterium GWC1_27_15]